MEAMKSLTNSGVPDQDSTDRAYLDIVAGRASEYIRRSNTSSTVLAYQGDWKDFQKWCAKHGKTSLPTSADSLMLYVSDLSETHRPSTLTRRIASISYIHRVAGYDAPTGDRSVRMVMAGIRRTKGIAPKSKFPILVDDLKRMISQLPEGVLGIRDRALLLVAFGGAFRRSELVGLDREDVEITGDGLVVTVRRSKVDQEGRGRKLGIPFGRNSETCPVRAYQAWLATSAITKGPIFRPITRHGKIIATRLSSHAIGQVVKRHARAIGLDPAQFAGHSLRSGLATAAALAGSSERAIMNQTGHHSTIMVRRYIRDANLFRGNVVSALGL